MSIDGKDFVRGVPLLNIELGGGNYPLYHPNIDLALSPTVDIAHDLTQGIPLPDNYADLIFSRDFIEHLSFPKFIFLLTDCKRVLRNEGRIEFITPDVEKALFTHSWWNEYTHHVVIGDDSVFRSGHWDSGNSCLRHRIWFSPELMRYILEKENWQVVSIEDYKKDDDWWKEPKMRVIATK